MNIGYDLILLLCTGVGFIVGYVLGYEDRQRERK